MIENFEELKFISLSEVDSTNNYVANLVRLREIYSPTIVSADYQTQGRGQRASEWQSSKAQNALFSIFVAWEDLDIAEQFLISMLTAISVVDVLERWISLPMHIKWPNDIYVNKKKIGGILIESDLNGRKLSSSIIGIGINVNQVAFESNISATSLKLESGQNHDRMGIIKRIGQVFLEHCLAISNDADKFNIVKKRYLKKLYSLNNFIQVEITATGHCIKIKPLDITRGGLLLATDDQNTLHTFDIKEIKWEI